MFPDSDIANTLTCSANKTAYEAKFGLATYIKDKLVSKVNKSPFVLIFVESFNETTKNKQLDVHVRFWDEGWFSPDILAPSLWDIQLRKTCCRISK